MSRPYCSTRRHFLAGSAFSLSSLALAWLLKQDKALADAPVKPLLEPQHYDLQPKPPHFQPRARAMISIFLNGGPSHIDLLDHQPLLEKYDGKPFPRAIKYDNPAQASSQDLPSPFKLPKRGQSRTLI